MCFDGHYLRGANSNLVLKRYTLIYQSNATFCSRLFPVSLSLKHYLHYIDQISFLLRNEPKMSRNNPSKAAIESLPNEIKDIICKECLLELYENEAEYLEADADLSTPLSIQVNTLTNVPGFAESNILAKSKYHPTPTLYLSCEDEVDSNHSAEDQDAGGDIPAAILRLGHAYMPFFYVARLEEPKEFFSKLDAALPQNGPLQIIMSNKCERPAIYSYICRDFHRIELWTRFPKICPNHHTSPKHTSPKHTSPCLAGGSSDTATSHD